MDFYMTGDWDRALADLEGIYRAATGPGLIALSRSLVAYTRMVVNRGDIERAERHIAALEGPGLGPGMLERIDQASGRGILLRAMGDPAAALQAVRATIENAWTVGFLQENVREGLVEAVESAVEVGDLGEAEGIVARLEQEPASALPIFLLANRSRLRAIIDAAKGDHEGVGPAFDVAAHVFRATGIPFWLAVTLTQYAEWLVGRGRAAEAAPLLDEASAIFERLAAAPWLERVGRVVGRQVCTSTGA
jgi:hypothetical protein